MESIDPPSPPPSTPVSNYQSSDKSEGKGPYLYDINQRKYCYSSDVPVLTVRGSKGAIINEGFNHHGKLRARKQRSGPIQPERPPSIVQLRQREQFTSINSITTAKIEITRLEGELAATKAHFEHINMARNKQPGVALCALSLANAEMKDLGGADHGVETMINCIPRSFLNGNDMEIIMNKGEEMYNIIMAVEKRADNKGNAGQD